MAPSQEDAIRWLDNYGKELGGYTSEELISHARDYLDNGDYWSGPTGMEFISESLPGDFWEYYQAATQETVPEGSQVDFFTCSC